MFFSRLLIYFFFFFFKIFFFFKANIPGVASECQTVLPDVLSGLTRVQTVCRWYQQTTLVGKDINLAFNYLHAAVFHAFLSSVDFFRYALRSSKIK